MSTQPVTKRARRTQSERTAHTRAALLDATIALLIEKGYAGVTTAEIASRAGVTRGAQAHHYSTKAELVTDAVRHLTQKLASEFLDTHLSPITSVEETLDLALERLWELHAGPLFAAAAELWLAARTDQELAKHVGAMETDVTDLVRGVADSGATILNTSQIRGATALITTTMATMRGLAMLSFVRVDGRVDKEWKQAKGHLKTLWEPVVAAAIDAGSTE